VENREGDQIESDFLAAVQDGTLLCMLLVTILPGSVPKFHNLPKLEFLMIENAQLFLNACQTFGVKPEQLCETLDITQKRNLKKITRVVCQIYQIAVERGYGVPVGLRSHAGTDCKAYETIKPETGFVTST
jgi:hypothetical protein